MSFSLMQPPLGATDYPDSFPWKASNDDVLFIQQSVNLDLDKAGYERITEDGVLGGQTCGAEYVVGKRPSDAMFAKMYPTTAVCLNHRDEWVEPKKKLKVAALAVAFVLASTAAVGAAYYAAKKSKARI